MYEQLKEALSDLEAKREEHLRAAHKIDLECKVLTRSLQELNRINTLSRLERPAGKPKKAPAAAPAKKSKLTGGGEDTKPKRDDSRWAKVDAMLKDGDTPAKVAEATKEDIQAIYTRKYQLKKAGLLPAGSN